MNREEMINKLLDNMCFLEKITDICKVNEIRESIILLDDNELERGYKQNRDIVVIRKTRIIVEAFIKENNYNFLFSDVIESFKKCFLEDIQSSESMTHCLKIFEKEIKIITGL